MREQEVTVIPEPKPKKKIFTGKLVFLVFTALVLSLVSYAFFGGNLPITGNVVLPSEKTYGIFASLGPLNSKISYGGKMTLIEISMKRNFGRIYLGNDNVIDLSKLNEPKLKISGFDGEISFDKRQVFSIRGTASKALLNNIPYSSATGKVDFELDSPIQYKTLVVKGIKIPHYKSKESGEVNLINGKISVKLKNELFEIESFSGVLRSGLLGSYGIKRPRLELSGSVSKVSIGDEFSLG